ncbi:U2 snRNP-associated SURP motif-containing protein-like [Antedon mediterranea]|uniref:U2 snRNP-associated SURP motif-containing protein-like n=1 Tax=Antedon mediterranea TaxID=105859 RepID=UPI003AF5A9D1
MADKRTRAKGLNPNSMKGISHTKLKAFSVGQMNIGKKKSKREEEEERKKHDEKATAKVFEEFVASFEDSGASATGKAFVRGSTINPETKEEKQDSQTGKMYKPSSKISESIMLKKQEEAKKAEKAAELAKKKKEKEKNKSKSNLENFLEELKVMQAEREIRHKLKKEIAEHSQKRPTEPKPALLATPDKLPGIDDLSGSHDTGDPQTTNIFLGSVNPKMTEEMLCQEFGKYGPLASVKIMWPRTDEERSRNRNCGFVAYMNRKDAERGMKNIDGKIIMEYEMKLGWGKTVPIPPHPVFIPPQMLQLTLPPPPSGLPFNAQTKDKRFASRQGDAEFPKTLKDAVVKVVIPTERPMLHLVHRMIEFVVREGPMFEAMIMNRELNNPLFRFLFENTSPAHIYYRWKLYSILQGDSPTQWRTKEFRMFDGGSYWKPPPLNPYLHGMAETLAGEKPPRKPSPPPQPTHRVQEEVRKRGMLSNHQRDKLEDMLRNLTMERKRISDTMVYCLDHGESAEEIVECISESLSILETPIPKKIGRLFLVSDILFNSSAKVANASYYRKFFEVRLPAIFNNLYKTHQSIQQRLKAEHFKNRIMACFRAWEDWAIYPNDLLVRLQNIFLGLIGSKKDGPNGDVDDVLPQKAVEPELDGLPIVDESVDGQAVADDIDGTNIEDVDGTELADDLDGNPVDDLNGAPISSRDADSKFKVAPSKWESVDASTLESQAMTSSKWELLENLEEDKSKHVDEEAEDEDGVPIEEDDDEDEQEGSRSYDLLKPLEMTEERRAKLRDIEMKVMKFQDDVEGGRRSRKSGMSIGEQVHKYRKKLLQKERERAIEKQRDKDREKSKQKEQDRLRDYERAREKERIRLVDASDSESDSSKQKRRRSSSGSVSPYNNKRYRSGSHSPASDRRSSRHESREVSPMSYDSPNIRKRSPSRKVHRSHRMPRPDSRSPGRRPRRSRSRSPIKRSYSPYRSGSSSSKSHRKKSKY